jgi:hypothetical protein
MSPTKYYNARTSFPKVHFSSVESVRQISPVGRGYSLPPLNQRPRRSPRRRSARATNMARNREVLNYYSKTAAKARKKAAKLRARTFWNRAVTAALKRRSPRRRS